MKANLTMFLSKILTLSCTIKHKLHHRILTTAQILKRHVKDYCKINDKQMIKMAKLLKL